MNIRIKAALMTVGYLAAGIITVSAIHVLLSVLTADQLYAVAGAAFIGFFVYVLYGITLSRLEYEAKLKEICEQK